MQLREMIDKYPQQYIAVAYTKKRYRQPDRDSNGFKSVPDLAGCL